MYRHSNIEGFASWSIYDKLIALFVLPSHICLENPGGVAIHYLLQNQCLPLLCRHYPMLHQADHRPPSFSTSAGGIMSNNSPHQRSYTVIDNNRYSNFSVRVDAAQWVSLNIVIKVNAP